MGEERKKILELVQSGKLSAQEAIVLLEALENDLKEAGSVGSAESTSDSNSDKKTESQSGDTASEGKKANKGQSAEDSFYSQLENAGERIFDFVNNALHKIKHIDLPFNQSVDVPHTFQQADNEFDRVDIDVANGPVRVTTWDQPDVRIECQAKVYRSDDRDDARKYFIDNTIFSIENGLLCFGTQSKWMRVETVIYIPKKQYKKISVRIFNGELSGEDIQADILTVKTTNGKVDLANIDGEKLDVETVNGQIKLAKTNADLLEAETVNGALDISGNFEVLELQSFNGNITCTLPECGVKRVEAKVVTGNIHVSLPAEATIDGDVRSNLGSYKLDLEGIDVLHEKKEIIQKQVQFKRPGSDEQVIHLLADTKTGSVHLKQASQPGE